MGKAKTSAKTPTKSAAKKTSAPAKVPAPAAAPTDQKAAYDFFLARAQALPAASVPVARGSATLARVNVNAAVKALKPHLATLTQEAPTIDQSIITNLPSLVRGFVYASESVPIEKSDMSIKKELAKVSPIRKAALSYLDSAVFCGLVDAGVVRKISAGRGKPDIAQDSVTIAGVFQSNAAALTGKHPFTAAHLSTLSDSGGWLVDQLKPGGAVKAPKVRSAAAQMRDRFAKLVDDDYAVLLKAAVAIFGVKNYAAQIPALYAGERAPKPATTAAAKTPKAKKGKAAKTSANTTSTSDGTTPPASNKSGAPASSKTPLRSTP